MKTNYLSIIGKIDKWPKKDPTRNETYTATITSNINGEKIKILVCCNLETQIKFIDTVDSFNKSYQVNGMLKYSKSLDNYIIMATDVLKTNSKDNIFGRVVGTLTKRYPSEENQKYQFILKTRNSNDINDQFYFNVPKKYFNQYKDGDIIRIVYTLHSKNGALCKSIQNTTKLNLVKDTYKPVNPDNYIRIAGKVLTLPEHYKTVFTKDFYKILIKTNNDKNYVLPILASYEQCQMWADLLNEGSNVVLHGQLRHKIVNNQHNITILTNDMTAFENQFEHSNIGLITGEVIKRPFTFQDSSNISRRKFLLKVKRNDFNMYDTLQLNCNVFTDNPNSALLSAGIGDKLTFAYQLINKTPDINDTSNVKINSFFCEYEDTFYSDDNYSLDYDHTLFELLEK